MTDSEDWESGAGDFLLCRKTPRATPGGQSRHEDHFLFEGGPVRVLCERRLKDLVFTLRISPLGWLFVEKSKEKEVTDSGKNEDDNRGGR